MWKLKSVLLMLMISMFFLLHASNMEDTEYIVLPGDTITTVVISSGDKLYMKGTVNYNNEYLLGYYNENTGESKAIGIIKTEGLSIKALEDSIGKFIKDIYPSAKVYCSVNSANYTVTVTAKSAPPIVIPYRKDFSLWDYVRLYTHINYYGLTGYVNIIHRNGETERVDYNDFFNYHPIWGDVINIPKDFIPVTGGVRMPRAYLYEPDKTGYYYVYMAGGAAHRGVNVDKSIIIKPDGTKIPITRNTIIEPGDYIKVPNPWFTPTQVVTLTLSIVSLGITVYSVLIQ